MHLWWLQSSYKGRREEAIYQGKPEVADNGEKNVIVASQSNKAFSADSEVTTKWLGCSWFLILPVSTLVLQKPLGFPPSLAHKGAVCPPALSTVSFRMLSPLGTWEQASTFGLGCESNCKVNAKKKKKKCFLSAS